MLASIGMGGVSHLPVLRRLLPASDARLAELLLQAPSELALLDDAAAAGQVSELLNASGLDTEIRPADHAFVAGAGEFDVAVFVDDLERVPEIIALIGIVLGLAPDMARDLLFGSPPALLGNVSAATVEALTRRFAALGATLVPSRRRDARYDLVIGVCPPRVRSHVLAMLADGGTNGGAGSVMGIGTGDDPKLHGVGGTGHGGPLVIEDLPREKAERLLAELSRSACEASVIDRAFERFEVRADACPTTPAAARCLVELTGMPPDIAARIGDNTPIVLLGDTDRDTMQGALVALAAVGASATADMTTFRRCRVHVERIADSPAARQVIERVTGTHERLGALPHAITATMNLTQARWSVRELAKVGADARVVTA